jgi:hypothetical protein
MNLETARQHIRTCRERMDALYEKPVFDEWVILAFVDFQATILAYDGPRADSFKQTLRTDAAPLTREMEDKHYAVGDFEFAHEARGSRFDACVRLGEKTYLLCNNTYGTMTDLRQDPRWLKAQKPFVDLTEKFRADELV